MSTEKELITIITEAVLETELCKKIEQIGATGYTVIDVRGKGHTGNRGGDWKESANIQIEVVCNAHLAEVITYTLEKNYFDDYAMIVYRSPVTVLRSDKF